MVGTGRRKFEEKAKRQRSKRTRRLRGRKICQYGGDNTSKQEQPGGVVVLGRVFYVSFDRVFWERGSYLFICWRMLCHFCPSSFSYSLVSTSFSTRGLCQSDSGLRSGIEGGGLGFGRVICDVPRGLYYKASFVWFRCQTQGGGEEGEEERKVPVGLCPFGGRV